MAAAVDFTASRPSSIPSTPSFTLDSKILRTAVKRAWHATARKADKRALEHIHVHAVGSTVVLTATDETTHVTISLPATVESPGRVLLPATQLVETLSTARGLVTISLSGAGAHVRTASGSWHILPIGDLEKFPSLPERPEHADIVIAREDLSRLVTRVKHAVGRDETRKHLTGVLVERSCDVLRLVACDGHRLALAEAASEGSDFNALVSGGGIDQLARTLGADGGAVRIRRTDDRIWFADARDAVSTPLLVEAFPAYRDVIPQHFDARVTFDRREMLSGLRAVKMRRQHGVKFDFKRFADGIAVSTSDGDHEASVEVRATYRGPTPRHIGFSHRYITEILSALDDGEVTLDVSGEFDPIRIVATDGSTFVLMPLRI